jgi:chaperonin GroES
MRKDQLAAGARTARFAIGGTKVPGADENIFRNVMSKKDAAKLDREVIATVEHAPVIEEIFRPRGTTILVRRVTVATISPLLEGVDSVKQEVPAEGTVLEIGTGEIDVARGDRVVFGKYAGTEFKLNGETLLIMDIADVKGTITRATPADDSPAFGCISGHIGRA